MKTNRNMMSIWLAATCVLMVLTASGLANTREMVDLNEDMQEIVEVAKTLSSDTERLFLSDMAVQNIEQQWAIWFYSGNKGEIYDQLLGSSYARFVVLHYNLNSPSWAWWGLTELETLLPSYRAYIDSTTELSYREQLNFVQKEWMYKFATCNAFNELIPEKKLLDNRVELKLRQGWLTDEEKYVIRTAERYLNRRLRDKREFFYFYLPPGEYQIYDQKNYIFSKEFTAGLDSSQYLYLTTNYSFNFVPVATVYSASGVTYDTLSASEFELVRLDEGRIFDFNNVEFGRYAFNVKPPYKIVDRYANKLIIPKEEFGANYLERDSELFNKTAYDQIILESGRNFVYNLIERADQTPVSNEKDKKK